MALRIVRLGSPRAPDEGLRIGTVRRPPRGVPRSEYTSQDWYDVWYPNLSPSPGLVKLALAAQTPAEWTVFKRRFVAEMKVPEAAHSIALLAALSQHSDLSVGCYCEDEARCHRSVLRELFAAAGARMAGD